MFIFVDIHLTTNICVDICCHYHLMYIYIYNIYIYIYTLWWLNHPSTNMKRSSCRCSSTIPGNGSHPFSLKLTVRTKLSAYTAFRFWEKMRSLYIQYIIIYMYLCFRMKKKSWIFRSSSNKWSVTELPWPAHFLGGLWHVFSIWSIDISQPNLRNGCQSCLEAQCKVSEFGEKNLIESVDMWPKVGPLMTRANWRSLIENN